MSDTRSLRWWVFGAVLVVLLVGVWIARNDNAPDSGEEIFHPIPLASGPQTYTISSKEPGPKMREAIISALDPKSDEQQTMKILVEDEVGVEGVSVAILRDGTEEQHDLLLATGTAMSGWWEGSWLLHGTGDHDYAARVTAVAKKASSTITITFR